MRFYVNVNGTLAEIGDGKSAYELAVYYGYAGTEQEWLESLHGKDGSTVTLNPNNKHWVLDGVDTGVKAEGVDGDTPEIDPVTMHWKISGVDMGVVAEGKDGATPEINPSTKHWIIDGTDTNIVAEGVDGNTPYINASNNWEIGGVDTGIKAKGETPNIDSSTKHWFIGGVDTGVVAEAKDGITPSIDSSSKHWMIGSTDTGIIAEGHDGATPQIDLLTKHWFIDGQDTGIIAEGTNGADGVDGKDGKSISTITKDDDNNIIVTFTDGSTQNISKLSVDIQGDFLTSGGFGNLRYYNGKFQYYNKTSSTWIDTVPTPDNVYIMNMTPQPMKNISLKYNRKTGYIEIKFTEPDDIYIDGQLLCAIEKIVLVRKKDSEPLSIDDGDKILELKRNNFGSYSKYPFVDNSISPNVGDIYYYRAFPVSTMGYVNDFPQNSKMIEVKDIIIYGFKIDQNESDPASMITYLSDCENANYASAYMDYSSDTFNYGDWADAWFIKKLKPCMLKYDGTVDYELNPNDYTKKLDGTDSDIANDSYKGNAMIGIPKVYWKIVDNGDDTANIYIADGKEDEDYVCWSHIDNNGNEIDYCYMPIYTGSVVSSRLRSISGKASMTGQTTTTEITYAKANNIGSDIIWYTEVFSDRMLINLLLLLIGKSTDTQTVFGTGNNNSHVSDSNTGIKNTGTMNTKGLFWGNKDNVSGVKVFGMEHWYGNIWRRIGGWINDKGTQKIKMTYGQSDGSTTDGYNETGSGYISIGGATPSGTSGGYISKMLITNNGLIPTIVNGSATTYYCDGFWFDNLQVDYACVGGHSYNDSRVGALSSVLDSASSFAHWGFGAALSCKPLATT